MLNFLKRKIKKEGLSKALELGLITEEEMLRLLMERAEITYKEYLERRVKKHRKK